MKGLIRDLACGPELMARLLKWRKTGELRAIPPRKVSFGPSPAQYFLDFAPAATAPRRETVVLYIHGGGWDKGSPAFFSFIGHRFAREGYRCIMPGYRLVPDARFPAQIEDVRAGTKTALSYLSYLSCLEEQETFEPQIVVVGSSAGAQLGALLCYDGELADRFAGFIGLGGPYRFDREPPLSLKVLSDRLLGGRDPRTAQPCCLLKENSPKTPMLLIHGLKDGVVGFACGMDFYRRALALDIPARLYLPETGRDSHSDYVVGCFLERRKTCGTVDTLFRWLEELEERAGEPLAAGNV